MRTLAIKGHATRGSEVIGLLEMLGGENITRRDGILTDWVYYIDNELRINTSFDEKRFSVFTLEQFLEKFPYKVGDKINLNGDEVDITGLYWDGTANEIIYEGISVELGREYDCINVKDMKPYTEQKEEKDMEENKGIFIGLMPTSNGHEIIPREGYEIKQDGDKFYVVKKQPQYPKTYEECCKIMGLDKGLTLFYGNYDCTPIHITEYSGALEQLLNKFMQLLICRDAYWKMAGKWKPDWMVSTDKSIITTSENRLVFDKYDGSYNSILAFPTEEVRDAFYDNFKGLIESCKELL